MKLYRYFRHHKYGEPRPIEQIKKLNVPSVVIKDEADEYGEEMQQEIDIIQKAKDTIMKRKRTRGVKVLRRNQGMNQELLGTVIEEESIGDSEMNSALKTRDPRCLYTKFECETFLLSMVIESSIYDQISLLADSLHKIHSLIKMWIFKRRYQRLKSS